MPSLIFWNKNPKTWKLKKCCFVFYFHAIHNPFICLIQLTQVQAMKLSFTDTHWLFWIYSSIFVLSYNELISIFNKKTNSSNCIPFPNFKEYLSCNLRRVRTYSSSAGSLTLDLNQMAKKWRKKTIVTCGRRVWAMIFSNMTVSFNVRDRKCNNMIL